MEQAVRASLDTKGAPSVVTDTLRSLSAQARICHDKINLLEAAQSFSRSDVLSEVGKLLDACQNLRDAILSEDSSTNWTTTDELQAVVARLNESAGKRRRYLDLAQFLSNGTVVHRRERTRQERLALRDKAITELMEISEQSTPPALPGPAVEQWLEWACSLEDDANELELVKLKNDFPRLDDFVRQLEIEWWHPGEAASPIEAAQPIQTVVPAVKNGVNSLYVNGSVWGKGDHDAPVSEEPVQEKAVQERRALEIPHLPEVKDSEEETSVAVTEEKAPVAAGEEHSPDAVSEQKAPVVEEKIEVAELPETIALAASLPIVEEDEEELPVESAIPSRRGKISFFSWDQVDRLSRHLEKAKIEKKDSRKVRALLAVSQWLEPRDQNPVFHQKCGIRTLTGYSGTTDVVPVAPSEVMRAIEADEGLHLFTGGADLLRWGLLQPSERNFQGIASVRRLSLDHLKAWFSDVFRIALSDKQISDIYNLTSGIPLLVSELHKLIIPVPEDPPTWLGLARWIEIKGLFEKQLPAMVQDLKKGSPAVRLTDREISLLNMVVIVSGDSTRETILANLSENWERYQHPEYRAVSSRDYASLALLMELGLLPMRNVVGASPSKALLPVKHDDAIRKIIELL